MVRCRGLSRMVLLAFTWHCLLLASSFSFFLYLISKTFFGDGLFTYLSLLQAAQTLGCYLIISSIKHWRKQWPPTAALLPGKSHGRRSLEGCSPWGRYELDTNEQLHFQFSLLCTGEGNGNPLQCYCLENPRDGGAWWAAVCGVAQSQTRLKLLSSSSSSKHMA